MSDDEAMCARCGLVFLAGEEVLENVPFEERSHLNDDDYLARLRSELSRLRLAGIHSCHDQCPREACVLRRENERLNALVSRQQDALVDFIGPDYDIDASPQTLWDIRQAERDALAAAEQRAEREAERAKALEKNAERYRWLRVRFKSSGTMTFPDRPTRYGFNLEPCVWTEHNTIDEAIDAARAAQAYDPLASKDHGEASAAQEQSK